MPTIHSFLAGLGLAAIPIQQSGERVPAVVRDEVRADASTQEVARQGVEGGEGEFVAFDELSDEVPLPVAPVLAAGLASDASVSPAGGDPFFLSFAAGPYYPPADQRLEPGLARDFAAREADQRPSEETYAFVMFSKRITDERLAALQAEGARVLEFHPHYTMKVALAPDAAERIATLPFVRWVGRAQAWQKLHPMLAERRQQVGADELLDVYVSTFERDAGGTPSATVVGSGETLGPDGVAAIDPASGQLARKWRSNGWQERRLVELGVELVNYHERTAVFRGKLRARDLERLVQQDFVQFVELDLPLIPMHDESMPMIQADRTRASFDGGTNSAVVAAIVDSGLDHEHFDLNHTWAAGWDLTGEGNPWFDGFGHGSHVGGTMHGNGDVTEGYTGGAPGLGWGTTGRMFNLKIFDEDGNWAPGADTLAILDRTHSDFTDGDGDTTPRPHVVNHSYGSGPGAWFGTEATARAIDTDAHDYDQLHVYAAGNYGPGDSTLTLQAATKNILSVANVLDHRSDSSGYPGSIWSASSRGPTGDDRWKPNLSAPGRWVWSVDAETSNQYAELSGTSMAAPHVTAVAAQLCDEFAFLRYRPFTLGAVLMASAMTKDDLVLSAPSTDPDHHLNVYGTGRIDAYRASGSNGQQSLSFWAFTQGTSGFQQVDVDVDPGATRLTVVMYYHEPAASAGAGSALVNDLDLWIDRAPFEAGGNTGEFFAHQSPRDNTEIRMIENPEAAAYRLKVFPDSATSNSRVGLCAIVSYGDTSPAATVSLTADPLYAQPDDVVELTGTVFNPEHVASAIHLTTSTVGIPFGDEPDSAIVTLEDGIQSDLIVNPAEGQEVTLGNIGHNRSRSVVWTTSWASEGVKNWSVELHGDNISTNGAEDAVQVVVDGTPPVGPTNLASSTHTVGVADCEENAQVGWTAATDLLAGLDGYSYVWTAFAGTIPNQTIDLGPGATNVVTPLENGTWYFHIRPVDRSGNWGSAVHFGPIVVLAPEHYLYCPANPNSTGLPGSIWFQGSLSISANDLVLNTSNLPSGQSCIFYYGPNEVALPFGNGIRCVGGTTFRLPIINTSAGAAQFAVDNQDLPVNGDFEAGEALKFQLWYRDPLGGGAFFNFSNALSLRFCP